MVLENCTADLVICTPEIIQRTIGPDDTFFIAACDGLWDVFDNQEAVDFVLNLLSNQTPPEKCAQLLVEKALELGSQDNISVIITFLNLPTTPNSQNQDNKRSNKGFVLNKITKQSSSDRLSSSTGELGPEGMEMDKQTGGGLGGLHLSPKKERENPLKFSRSFDDSSPFIDVLAKKNPRDNDSSSPSKRTKPSSWSESMAFSTAQTPPPITNLKFENSPDDDFSIEEDDSSSSPLILSSPSRSGGPVSPSRGIPGGDHRPSLRDPTRMVNRSVSLPVLNLNDTDMKDPFPEDNIKPNQSQG